MADISKRFDNDVVAVDGFSLHVKKGDFVSLLGPSGCGKSTVLRMLAGLSSPSSGQINWPASSCQTLGHAKAASEHALSFVFQSPTLMPWASVFDNVYFPLKISRVSKALAKDRVMDALELVGLEDVAKSLPSQLSGGMQMRVSIARALVTNPQVLLMDEPFAALDEITRNKLNDDLLGLWQKFGWTILFVTHSVYESVYLSNRLVVMGRKPGRIFEDFAVDVPYPRGKDFRTSADYGVYCKRALGAIEQALTN
nr:ABC transporter ATP-binding protein [Pseudovibrio sp. M1P-2-3]